MTDVFFPISLESFKFSIHHLRDEDLVNKSQNGTFHKRSQAHSYLERNFWLPSKRLSRETAVSEQTGHLHRSL